MKKLLFLLLLFISNLSVSQNLQTKEHKIKYSNGRATFNVCINPPNLELNENLKYNWFSEESGIKETQGYYSDYPLHGRYEFFDLNGNLRSSNYYYLGQNDGKWFKWDENGNIVEKGTYSKGKPIKSFHKKEDGGTVEITWSCEKFFTQCTHKNNRGYTTQIITLNIDATTSFEIYHDNSKTLKQKFTENKEKNLIGEYREYYPDGTLQVKGYFSKKYPYELKDSTWIWYNEDGSIYTKEEYTVIPQYYENNKLKQVVSCISSSKIEIVNGKELEKHGMLYTFDIDGDIEDVYEYDHGKLVEQ